MCQNNGERIFFMKKTITPFRVSPDDMHQVKQMVKSLKEFCNLKKIPMFVTIATANSSEGTSYFSDAVLASTGYTIKENRVAALLLELNEFQTDLPPKIKKHMAELQAYLDRVRMDGDGNGLLSTSGRVLEEDRILDGLGISVRGDVVRLPVPENGDPNHDLLEE